MLRFLKLKRFLSLYIVVVFLLTAFGLLYLAWADDIPLKDRYGVTQGYARPDLNEPGKATVVDQYGVTKGTIDPKGTYDPNGRQLQPYPDVDRVLKPKDGR